MVGLIEVVWDALGVQEGEGCGVERVLWDWDEDTGVWTGADDVEEGVDSGRGAGCEVDLVWVGWVTITLCYMLELCSGANIQADTNFQ